MKILLLLTSFLTPLLSFAQSTMENFEQRLLTLEKQQQKNRYSPTLRGQIQLDTAFYGEDSGLDEDDKIILEDGMNFRRVRLEARGSLNERVGYRAQIDFAKNDPEIKNLWISYSLDSALLRFGNMKTPTFHEDTMSSSDVGFLERGMGTNAFNFGRMTGIDLSGDYRKRMTYQLGVYSTGLSNRAADVKTPLAFGARLTGVILKADSLLFTLGAHYMKGSQQSSVRFRARANTHVSSNSIYSTGVIDNTHQSEVMGAEALFMFGTLSFLYEAGGATASPMAFVGDESYSFSSHQFTLRKMLFGGRRDYSYKSGNIEEIKIESDLSKGGMGAIEATARVSIIDLNDTQNGIEVRGGKGQVVSLGLTWAMLKNFQTILDISQVEISDSGTFVDQDFKVAQMRVEVKF